MILSSNTMHFQRMFVNFYADKSVDFSADVSTLIRSLGIVNLLTLVFGLTVGAAMALTSVEGSRSKVKDLQKLSQYERTLTLSGLVNVTKTPEGTTYQLTEMGRRFLTEYAYLQRQVQEPPMAHQER
jgi:hypothetical protein